MTWSPREPRPVTTMTPLDTRGPKRLWDAPAGLVQRDRGDVGRLVRHDYRCPVHGVFELEVPSSDVPDAVECGAVLSETEWSNMTIYDAGSGGRYCARPASWSPSAPAIWPSSGEVSG